MAAFLGLVATGGALAIGAYAVLGEENEPAVATDASGNPIVCAAGDIAARSDGDDLTAALLGACDHIITLGDNAYQSGTLEEFQRNYDPSWGATAKSRTHPSVGNHEYRTPDAAGYKAYFGDAAQPSGTTYYSWSPAEQPNWLLVAWDSNCGKLPRGLGSNGCAPGSPQNTWLKTLLAVNTRPCVLVYSHHPYWSIGQKPTSNAKPLWKLATQHGVDLVLNGHDHNYQRWAKLDVTGNISATGTRQVINGEGGASHYAFRSTSVNVEASQSGTFGIVRLTLGADSYHGEFVPVAGGTFTDDFSSTCNG